MVIKADLTLPNGNFMTMFVLIIAMFVLDYLREKKWGKGIGLLLLPSLTISIFIFISLVPMSLL